MPWNPACSRHSGSWADCPPFSRLLRSSIASPSSRSRSSSKARPAPARNSRRARSTMGARGATGRSSPSTAPRSRRRSSRASSSATQRGAFTGADAERGPFRARPTAARCSSTRSASSRPTRRSSCCASCRTSEFRPLGGRRERQATSAIVAATNRRSSALVAAGRFRATSLPPQRRHPRVPPLRERGDDIVLLAEHFVRTLRRRYGGRRSWSRRDPSRRSSTIPGRETCASWRTGSTARSCSPEVAIGSRWRRRCIAPQRRAPSSARRAGAELPRGQDARPCGVRVAPSRVGLIRSRRTATSPPRPAWPARNGGRSGSCCARTASGRGSSSPPRSRSGALRRSRQRLIALPHHSPPPHDRRMRADHSPASRCARMHLGSHRTHGSRPTRGRRRTASPAIRMQYRQSERS